MCHDNSAVLVGEAESPTRVVAARNSAGAQAYAHAHAHNQTEMHLQTLHQEGEGDADAGQRQAVPAMTSPEPTQVQPSSQAPSSSTPGISLSSHQYSHGVVSGRSGNAGQTGVTISSPDTPLSFSSAVSKLAADTGSSNNHSIATPPTEITPQSHRVGVDFVNPPPKNTTTTGVALASQTTIEHPTSADPASAASPQPANTLIDGAADVVNASKQDKMIFAPTTSNSIQRRRNYATTNVLTDYEADLTSRDRAKQKEAVKKYLAERVKNDWQWDWPHPEGQAALQPTSTIEEDPDIVWKERDEWLSNGSDDGDDMKMPIPANTASSHDTPTPTSKKSTGSNSESAGGKDETVKNALFDRKRRRKKRLAEEMAWNEGLRCFVARRDAWTCARKIPRASGTAVANTTTRASLSSGDGGSSTAIEQDDDDQWEDEVEIAIAPPILPSENAMRASILPGAYNTIYDKVVVQSLTPSCPMNLKDVIRSCVQGWKRDGEWPPKANSPEKKKGRKMSVASLLGFKEQERYTPNENANGNGATQEASKDSGERKGSGIRRSIQKILKLGHGGD